MIVLIRHGTKDWANGKRPSNIEGWSHDPPLNKSAKSKLKETREKLLDRDLIPTKIITSPFLRCRQTAKILSQGDIPITVDADWREYLGNWHDRKDQVHLDPETLESYDSEDILIETFTQLVSRVQKLYRKKYLKQGNVWIVTHGIVILILQKLYSEGIPPKKLRDLNRDDGVNPGNYIILKTKNLK